MNPNAAIKKALSSNRAHSTIHDLGDMDFSILSQNNPFDAIPTKVKTGFSEASANWDKTARLDKRAQDLITQTLADNPKAIAAWNAQQNPAFLIPQREVETVVTQSPTTMVNPVTELAESLPLSIRSIQRHREPVLDASAELGAKLRATLGEGALATLPPTTQAINSHYSPDYVESLKSLFNRAINGDAEAQSFFNNTSDDRTFNYFKENVFALKAKADQEVLMNPTFTSTPLPSTTGAPTGGKRQIPPPSVLPNTEKTSSFRSPNSYEEFGVPVAERESVNPYAVDYDIQQQSASSTPFYRKPAVMYGGLGLGAVGAGALAYNAFSAPPEEPVYQAPGYGQMPRSFA